ncbi:serine/threonine protein kinase [Nonomuraea aridisoli]|uniref:non-specific serine/threonine protein kinase n=1 Tax=Nonomuraea aridisoli TaxID=2070368 RepID=A0A2W2D1R5_9ACTN|nr:serine/threonine protein kinase [Nonomuraea aridisoli]
MIDGRFELVERLGGGGMGLVWRAWDVALHREVALKEVRPPYPSMDGHDGARALRARVLREARALARLNHPHVATIHHIVDPGEHGYPWIVMELVTGGSLQDRIQRGPMPPADAARLGREVLSALRAAHAVGIQHRDVKPANVLLREDGRSVLSDFGIAAVRESTHLTATGAFIGSPEYMAPERINGVEGDPASDLWSLGMMLYVAVEGRHPLRRTTTLATLAAVLNQDVPPPERAGPLGPVLKALLTRDPAARPDAETLDLMLAAAADPGEPPAPPHATGSGRRPGTRHRRTSAPMSRADPAGAPDRDSWTSAQHGGTPDAHPRTPARYGGASDQDLWTSARHEGTPDRDPDPGSRTSGQQAGTPGRPPSTSAQSSTGSARPPGGPSSGGVPPGEASWEVPAPRPRRRGGAGAAVALSLSAVVVAGVLVWHFLPAPGQGAIPYAGRVTPTSAPGLPTGSPSGTAEPEEENLLTPDGIRAMISELRPVIGGDKIVEMVVYPTYASVDVPLKDDPELYDTYAYRDGAVIHAGRGGKVGTPLVDLGAFDWDAIPALLRKANRSLGVPKPTSRYLIVDPDYAFAAMRQVLLVYVSDGYRSGYLVASPKGKILKLHPDD